jgi:hypothetical protein
MASGTSFLEGHFIDVGQGFLRVLLGSRALRWTMPEVVLGDVALWRRFYLAAKPSHVGGGLDVDGVAYPLHRHTTCSHQSRGQSFLSGTCQALPCPIMRQWAVAPFRGGGV